MREGERVKGVEEKKKKKEVEVSFKALLYDKQSQLRNKKISGRCC